MVSDYSVPVGVRVLNIENLMKGINGRPKERVLDVIVFEDRRGEISQKIHIWE
jgi:hypothetical protein